MVDFIKDIIYSLDHIIGLAYDGKKSAIDYQDFNTASQMREIEKFANNLKTEISTMTSEVNRVEVIDNDGRSYVNIHKDNKVELSFQDENKTLKIFIER